MESRATAALAKLSVSVSDLAQFRRFALAALRLIPGPLPPPAVEAIRTIGNFQIGLATESDLLAARSDCWKNVGSRYTEIADPGIASVTAVILACECPSGWKDPDFSLSLFVDCCANAGVADVQLERAIHEHYV